LPYKLDSYVILTVPVTEIELLRFLISKVKALSSLNTFNPHARFIFVVTESFDNIKLVLEGVFVVTVPNLELSVHDSKT
jgi:hypothetical protein